MDAFNTTGKSNGGALGALAKIVFSNVIYFENTEGSTRVNQDITSPSVYLDHWALRAISESDGLASRFAGALTARNGTLVLSWLNVVEFSKVADSVQREKADSLLDRMPLNVFWLNPDFFTVGKTELEMVNGQNNFPHSDLEFLRFYVTTVLERSQNAQEFRAPRIFTAIHHAVGIRNQYDDLADQMIFQLKGLREDFERDSMMRSAVKKPPRRGVSVRGTRVIARALIGRCLKDKLLKLSRNNAVDLTHAVVSVSYCDYVLLDTLWTTMVNEMRRDLATAGLSIPIAKVFSQRSGGLEAFLKDLESSRPSV